MNVRCSWGTSLHYVPLQTVTNSRAKPQKTPSVEKHAIPPRVVYTTLTRFTKSRVWNLHISKGGYPVTLLPPPRRLVPSLGLGTTWVRQLRSGSCHHPTAATKCSEQSSQATENPVGGKACSSTKGGLLHYIPNTYSIHKVSSLKFAYFQGRLSCHTDLDGSIWSKQYPIE